MTHVDIRLPNASPLLALPTPICVRRPHAITRAAANFTAAFPGETLYAVKANPEDWVLDALIQGGVSCWETASLSENVALSRLAFQHRRLTAFMHPVKPVAAIREAYNRYGCRVFALDHADELEKILAATDNASDLTLMIRIAVSNAGARLPLIKKFGVDAVEATRLLQRCAAAAQKVGLSFHVGSQNMRPDAFAEAFAVVERIALAANTRLNVLDVGGGFPECYPGLEPTPFDDFISAIRESAAHRGPLTKDAVLWCEPGRALVAAGASVVTSVLLRKGATLYLDDGGSGALFDAVHTGWRFPARVLRAQTATEPDNASTSLAPSTAFTVYGPTCDSDDVLEHPVWLPADVQTGDRIEFGMLGAYGLTMASRFNGFGVYEAATASDDPWPSLFMPSVPGVEAGAPGLASLEA